MLLIAIKSKLSFLFGQHGPKLIERSWISGDARLIIVAGSDTTAASLTYITYHLARAPHVVVKLREELRLLNYRPGHETELRDIQDAKYLNGVINEALRLHPPVPSGILRLTPPEGITIDGKFIPGGVTISAPSYSMGRRKLPSYDSSTTHSIADNLSQSSPASNTPPNSSLSDGATDRN